jgi:hypothetical protein
MFFIFNTIVRQRVVIIGKLLLVGSEIFWGVGNWWSEKDASATKRRDKHTKVDSLPGLIEAGEGLDATIQIL